MNRVLDLLGGEYMIQNRTVKVLEAGKADDSPTDVVFLAPEFGLIGSPERLRVRKEEAKPDAEAKKPGWKLQSLLRPEIEPGSWVAAQCRQIPRPTAYRVEQVEHEGDTHPAGDEPWTSTTEVSDPGEPV
jgi:hypothetical protein